MNIAKIQDCYGCGVCAASCPTKIISIEENKNGFYVPIITNSNKCTDCGMCLSVCSFYNDIEFHTSDELSGYAGWSNDKEIRYNSSSGGVAFEMARAAVMSGYKFCGVKYDIATHRAKHYITDNIEEVKKSLGSKYIPSFTLDALKQLSFKDKYIIFGTPCQVASIRLWIKKRKKEEQFILVDFFCHGVPSLKMLDKYIKSVEKEIGKIDSVCFRDKKMGWHDSYNMLLTSDTKKWSKYATKGDLFYKFFLGHYALAPACLKSCKFKMYNSSADIRIGDFWGETYKDNSEGVSSILTLTETGKSIIENISKTATIIETAKEIVTEGQMRKMASTPEGYNLAKRLLLKNISLQEILNILDIRYRIIHMPRLLINKIKNIL